MSEVPTLSVSGLSVDYPLKSRGFFKRSRSVNAVHDVSFDIAPGETLGLVGESGSGKTTVGRAILRRLPAAQGRIAFEGQDITGTEGAALRRLRARMPDRVAGSLYLAQPAHEDRRYRRRTVDRAWSGGLACRGRGAGARALGSGRAERRRGGAPSP